MLRVFFFFFLSFSFLFFFFFAVLVEGEDGEEWMVWRRRVGLDCASYIDQ